MSPVSPVSRQFFTSISQYLAVSRSISPVSRQYLASISRALQDAELPAGRSAREGGNRLAPRDRDGEVAHGQGATPMQAGRVGGGEGQGRTGREVVAGRLAMQGGDEGKGGGGFP